MNKPLGISVIVPTYNRSTLLPVCLDSLVKQKYPRNKYEIIIVDNNSNDNTKQVVEKFIKLYSDIQIKYVFEPKNGLVFARHAGLWKSRYDILSYTDDDGILSPLWLREIATVFNKNKSVAAVGGKITIRWDTKPPVWIKDYEHLLGKLDYGDEIRFEKGIYINGGNFSIKKQILIDLGGFNPDQIGDWLIGDGESGLCRKLFKADLLIGWSPGALMEHYQIVSKNATKKDITRRYINNGRCDAYHIYVVEKGGLRGLFKNSLKSVTIILKLLIKQLISVLTGKKHYHYKFDISYYYTQCMYMFKIIFNQQFRKMLLKENWLNKPKN